MVRVKFTADFATKRIGDVCEFHSQLASSLVHDDKVAEYTKDDLTIPNADNEHFEVVSDVEEVSEEEVKEKKAKKEV